jgi:hypothetical protein
MSIFCAPRSSLRRKTVKTVFNGGKRSKKPALKPRKTVTATSRIFRRRIPALVAQRGFKFEFSKNDFALWRMNGSK